jgi:hypothetical protein
VLKQLISIRIIFFFVICTASIYGKRNANMPRIQVGWQGQRCAYTLKDNHLRAWPLFKLFDRAALQQYLLPQHLSYRYHDERCVEASVLVDLLQMLICQVQQGKQELDNFTILCDKSFNKKIKTGTLVVRFNDYPFVVKLFIENPYSFIHPLFKGIDEYILFLIGGGVTRHMMGFTRLSNMHHIHERLSNDSYWKEKADVPRKWLWIPENVQQLEIVGINCGQVESQHMLVPSIYCIIADAIDSQKSLSCFNVLEQERKLIMDLFNYLDMRIDPNFDNFMVEKETNKIIIIDTEHWPTLIGLTYKPCINNYFAYGFFLVKHFFNNVINGPGDSLGIPFDAVRTCDGLPVSTKCS